MDENENGMNMDRRNFFRVASAGLAVAGVTLTPAEQALAQFKTDKDRLARIASCTVMLSFLTTKTKGSSTSVASGVVIVTPEAVERTILP